MYAGRVVDREILVMCGIAGIFEPGLQHLGELPEIIARMGKAIRHRGPDSAGCWLDIDSGYAVSHQRLAIMDVSPGGHQPMVSACGRYVLAFNGEIYSFEALRKQVEAHGPVAWRGHSDTEVLLEAVAAFGLEATLEEADGMFAIGLWDRDRRVLSLARDRFGKKPLYVGWLGSGGVVYGSELKALAAHPSFKKRVCGQALQEYLRLGYISGAQSIYEGVYRLSPGSWVEMDADFVSSHRSCSDFVGRGQVYWDVEQVVRDGEANPFAGNDDEMLDELERILGRAVGCRMMSDVPLGAFLSGGIDSSLVVALMQAQSSRPVRTYSIGFNESRYDESSYAAEVARHLKTDHTEFRVSPADAMKVIPSLGHVYDEPFSDSSQIPSLVVSRLARKHVTVVLTGDGGDELFGGYARYNFCADAWERVRRIPLFIRRGLVGVMRAMPPSQLNLLFRLVGNRLAGTPSSVPASQFLNRFGSLFAAADPYILYESNCYKWQDPGRLVVGATGVGPGLYAPGHDGLSLLQWMMLFDAIHYLPGDILVKMDRASMAVSLEARSPLLDHRVTEFAARLPMSTKIRQGCGKWPLKEVLYRHIPAEMFDRPKMGFGVPIGYWLRHDLRDWAEALLNEDRLSRGGILNPKPIRKLWEGHLASDTISYSPRLWSILMFQAWAEKHLGGDLPASSSLI